MGYYRFIGLFIDPKERKRVKQFFEKEYAIKQLHHFRCTHVSLDTKNPDYHDLVHAETRIETVCYATHYLCCEHIQVLKIEVPFPHKKKRLHLTMSIADNSRNPGYPILKSCAGNSVVESFELMLQERPEVAAGSFRESDHYITIPEPLRINGTIDAYRHNSSYRY